MPKIPNKQRIAIIEEEYGEPIPQVLQNYYDDGYGITVVSQILGVHHRMVYRWEKEYGLSLRRRTAIHLQLKRGTPTQAIAAAALVNQKYFMPNGSPINMKKEAHRIGITDKHLRIRIQKWGVVKALSTPKMRHAPTHNTKKANKDAAAKRKKSSRSIQHWPERRG